MTSFIRFQTTLRCRYTARRAGIFVAAGRIKTSPQVPDYLQVWLGELLEWFGEHLTMPDLNEDHGWRAFFWFRCSTKTNHTAMIAKMWELVTAMRDAGVPVQMHRTADPGRIVYADEQQVAAAPHRLRSKRRRDSCKQRRHVALRV